jgi:hypothetical protein
VLVLNNKEFQVPGLADRTGSDLDDLIAVSNILITLFEPSKSCFFSHIYFQVKFKSYLSKSLTNCRCIYITSSTVSKIDSRYMKFYIVTITLTLLLDRIKPLCRPLSNFLLYLFYRFIPTISKEEYDRKFYKVNSGRVLVLNNIEFHVPGKSE